MYRTLNRLVDAKYLVRVPRRTIGGNGAGSGQYVYELGQNGWTFIGGTGQYHPRRTVHYHTVAIPDVFIELVKLQRLGRIEIKGYAAEPDSHVTIEGVKVRPDLYVEIADNHKREDQAYWFEIDMGTERQKAIAEKLEAYVRAADHADDETVPIFPLVVFIAPDDIRTRELQWFIDKLPEDKRDLFFVSTQQEFAALLF